METHKSAPAKVFQSYLIISTNPNLEINLQPILDKYHITFSNSLDNTIVSPDRDSISIDKIRELARSISQKPVSQNYKLTIIENADLLTTEAQNALLKMLEEPPIHALIVLVAKSTQNFLPTILSRVVEIHTHDTLDMKEKSMHPTGKQGSIDLQLLDALQEDPKIYLDNQLQKYYAALLKNVNNPGEREKLQRLIIKTQETRRMVLANVNPKFAIANLILSSETSQ